MPKSHPRLTETGELFILKYPTESVSSIDKMAKICYNNTDNWCSQHHHIVLSKGEMKHDYLHPYHRRRGHEADRQR